ncbi:hypothetical protein NSQ43_07325 [Sporosarcina sp. FSL W8-0480]|uniref:hypothetical protein n=1 Tax=Sporosarcina sp. FSL W8-0480 TaxID=2954701 RepID=UPI0030DD46F2
MEERNYGYLDILLYTLALLSAFALLFFSDTLAEPLITEYNSGTSIISLMFNREDSISVFINLLIPLLMKVAGLAIFVITFWNITKNILFETEMIINKIIVSILLLIISVVVGRALLNALSLVMLALLFAIASFIIFALIGALLNNSSSKQH